MPRCGVLATFVLLSEIQLMLPFLGESTEIK